MVFGAGGIMDLWKCGKIYANGDYVADQLLRFRHYTVTIGLSSRTGISYFPLACDDSSTSRDESTVGRSIRNAQLCVGTVVDTRTPRVLTYPWGPRWRSGLSVLRRFRRRFYPCFFFLFFAYTFIGK